MKTPASVLPRTDPGLDAVRELAEQYGRTHGVDVWVWRREEDEWTFGFGTSARATRPGSDAAVAEGGGGRDLLVEVGGEGCTDPSAAARFLAGVIRRTLRHEAESRFFGRELAERYEEITLLYGISEILGSVISLEEAGTTILKEVVDTMGVRRAALWIHDAGKKTLELVAAVGGDDVHAPIPVNDDWSITAGVFRERRSMILEPGDEYPRAEREPAPQSRESFLSVPVSYTPPQGETRTIGVINLIGRTLEEGFSAGDQKLITAIASQIGAAVENNRLVAASLRQERLVREMELAHDLQLKLLPSAEEFRDRAEVAARFSPAESVGGDFYHLFRLPGGRLGVMIGDVSSHGFAAALIMALTMSAIAIHASEGDPPAEVLRRLHRALIDELESTEMYFTLFYGVIDPAQRRLTYANAGHPHAFRIPASGEAERLAPTDPPFGIVDVNDYTERSTEWNAGADLLFLFTDGLSESLGFGDGEQLLVTRVLAGRNEALDDLIASLFAIEGAESDLPSDDRTAVLVRA